VIIVFLKFNNPIIFYTFAADGYTEFPHIAIERGLRDGSLSAVGIPYRWRTARIRAAEILRQLSFAGQ
jgi:hypothetical protein